MERVKLRVIYVESEPNEGMSLLLSVKSRRTVRVRNCLAFSMQMRSFWPAYCRHLDIYVLRTILCRRTGRSGRLKHASFLVISSYVHLLHSWVWIDPNKIFITAPSFQVNTPCFSPFFGRPDFAESLSRITRLFFSYYTFSTYCTVVSKSIHSLSEAVTHTCLLYCLRTSTCRRYLA